MLADEAAALIVADPRLWVRTALLPSLPLGVAGLAYVHVHRTVWIHEPWEGAPLVGSVAFGFVLMVAYLVRGVGHGATARAVVRRLHPAAEIPDPRLPVWDLACAAALGAAATLLGAAMLLLPGIVLAGRFADLPGAVAVEGRGVAAGLSRPRPAGSVLKAARGASLAAGVGFLVWVNLVFGASVSVVLLRALTGLDVGLLSAAVSPANGAFLATAAMLAWLIVDPLWAVLRAMLYLDVRLGRSGADLADRWEAARPGVAAAGTALLVLLFAGPVGAQDEDTESPDAYADRLDATADRIDAAVEGYEASGWEDLEEIKDESWTLYGIVALSDGGSLAVDGAILLEDLPAQIHTDSTSERATRTATMVHEAASAARRLGESKPAEGVPPEALLDAVLADGGYDVEMRGVPSDRRRQGLRDGIAARWQELLDWLFEPNPVRRTRGSSPRFDVRWLGAGAALAAVFVLILVLGMRFGESRGRPGLRDRAGPGRVPSDLPDARSRTPDGWSRAARAFREEGRHREAVRAHYLAVLAALDRRREIDYRPEHTNGALVRGYRGPADGLGRFAWATGAFERAWYGEDEPDLPQVDAMEATCRELVVPEART